MVLKSGVMKVFILIEYITANAATIENLYVPEVVQSGSTDVVLCCEYSSLVDNDSVVWLFNGERLPEQWGMNIKNGDIPGSRGRYALTSVSKQSVLSFQRVANEMSGNYTCEVISSAGAVVQTKHMSVFSPENDFTLRIKYINKHKTVDVGCTAWGLYPRPDITLEIDKPVSQQVQRVWWKEDSAFAAEGTASLRDLVGKHEVTCRLHLPQADYTAIMKKYVNVDNEMCCGSHSTISSAAVLFITTFVSLVDRSLNF